MCVIKSVSQMQSLVKRLSARGKQIALVPTMGYLHEGHLSLIRKAKRHSDIVITTIFINPAQFAPSEDLSRYPRDQKGDLHKIRSAGGDIVFTPSAKDMYPSDFQTWVQVDELTKSLEGAARPTHFRGVTTVVAKLFNICRPDVVVFGMKDFQQATVLERMTSDLGYPIKFIIARTVRERDGLAMSSRNAYLASDGRKQALCLYRALMTAKAMVRAGMSKSSRIEKEMRAAIRSTAPGAGIDYIAFTDSKALKPVASVGHNTICSLAVRIGSVRLIDNMKLR